MINRNNESIVRIVGLSTDTKPTFSKEAQGSVFIEINTSKAYIFNGTTLTWKELTITGNGSSSGSSVTYENYDTMEF